MSPRRSLLLPAAVLALGVPSLAAGHGGRDGARHDMRATGACGRGAHVALRLRAGDEDIEARLRIAGPAGAAWRIALVHERRIAWRGRRRADGRHGRVEVERDLRALAGANAVTALAWGPRGLTCRVGGRIPGR